MPHNQTLQLLQESLDAIRQDRLSVANFCSTWRGQTELLAALPGPYTTVMEDLLGRLEAGSLFTEESCSFSQIDLLTTLDMWLDNARKTLG